MNGPLLLHALVLVMALWAGAASAREAWTALAEQGRALYFGEQAFREGARIAQAPMPNQAAACVNCHGPNGLGSREAAQAAPDVRWPTLMRRGATDIDALTRAMQLGNGSDGRPLAPMMPRYAPTADEAAALQAFWPWLGDEAQPVRGVEPQELRLGLALSALTRPDAAAQIAAAVRDELARVNGPGGIHGRQLRLVDVDERNPTVMDNVFALVASAPSETTRRQLRARRIPSLAALGMDVDDAAFDDWQLPMMPSLRQQAQAAVQALDAVDDCEHRVHDPAGWLRGETSKLEHQASNIARSPIGARLCVLALAPASEVDQLRAEWESTGAHVTQLIELAWLRGRVLRSPGLAHTLVLPVPKSVAEHASQAHRSLWYVLGQAAARTSIEAIARSGRNLQPEEVLKQMREMLGFEPIAGAPLGFKRGQPHGWAPERYSLAPEVSPVADRSTRRSSP